MLRVQPDGVLCKLAARGNSNAYDVLYQRYRQPVFAFVFHLLGRRDGTEDAEDIAQETFTKAFAGIREKRLDGSFKHWIFTIARNGTFDNIRGRRTPVDSLDAETTEIPVGGEKTETALMVEHRDELAWLMTTVADLPERQREALLMKELGGMSHNEIAAELDTTVSATKKLIGRGRETVTEAASLSGYRSKKLSRELAMAAPILPLAAAGFGMSAAAGGGAAAAAGGGALLGGKAAATVLTIVAIGGGTVAVEHHQSKADGPAPIADKTVTDDSSNSTGRRGIHDGPLAPLRRENRREDRRGGSRKTGHGRSGSKDRSGSSARRGPGDDDTRSGDGPRSGGRSGSSEVETADDSGGAAESGSGKQDVGGSDASDSSGRGSGSGGESGSSGKSELDPLQPPSSQQIGELDGSGGGSDD
jgi:RNA polymerase sigma factor (sigma-70 family)